MNNHGSSQKQQQKSEDELWVDVWLKKIGKCVGATQQKTIPKRSIPLHVAKHHLRNSLLILSKLQGKCEELQKHLHGSSSSDWERRMTEVEGLKNEYTALMSNIDSPETLHLLRRSVLNRKKKRQRLKRQKEEKRRLKALELLEREKLHKSIDEWLLNMKEAVERTKMEEKMKKEADLVLAEVTKKKSDARKQLSLLSSLIKLRNIREHMAVQRGENVSLVDRNAFAKVTDDLTRMWEKSQQVYVKEEHGLKVMLEQNAEQDSNTIRMEKEKRVAGKWTEVLFGAKVVPSEAYFTLTAADKNFETFVAVRKTWDSFLVPSNDADGSKIPIGWVLPSANARDDWKRYMQAN